MLYAPGQPKLQRDTKKNGTQNNVVPDTGYEKHAEKIYRNRQIGLVDCTTATIIEGSPLKVAVVRVQTLGPHG